MFGRCPHTTLRHVLLAGVTDGTGEIYIDALQLWTKLPPNSLTGSPTVLACGELTSRDWIKCRVTPVCARVCVCVSVRACACVRACIA